MRHRLPEPRKVKFQLEPLSLVHDATGVTLGMIVTKARQCLKDKNSPFLIVLDRLQMGEAILALERSFIPYFETRIAGIVPPGDWHTLIVADGVAETYAEYADTVV